MPTLPSLEFQRQDWMTEASCRYQSPPMLAWVDEYRHGVVPTHAAWVNEFFGGRGGRPRGSDQHSSQYADIRKLCAACPKRSTCTDLGINDNALFGLWGGLTQRERRAERRTRVVVRRTPMRVHGTPGAYRYHLALGETPCWQCTDAASRSREALRAAVA